LFVTKAFILLHFPQEHTSWNTAHAEQVVFDAVSGDLFNISPSKKKQKKTAHKTYTETATAK
jgi:hypothetical protein